jgi:hypothetical protein
MIVAVVRAYSYVLLATVQFWRSASSAAGYTRFQASRVMNHKALDTSAEISDMTVFTLW